MRTEAAPNRFPGRCRFCREWFSTLEPLSKKCGRCRELTKLYLCAECDLYSVTHRRRPIRQPYVCWLCLDLPPELSGRR